jgi:sec-independent protein translocase protein TatB
MFDFGIGYTELLVIAVVAIIVIGPKDLPRVLRALGRMMAKLRGMAREFQGHVDAAMRETGFDEVKRDLQSMKSANPMADVAKDLKKQGDDFNKYFHEEAGKSSTPVAAKPAEAVTDAKAPDNDFDTYFSKPKTDSLPS